MVKFCHEQQLSFIRLLNTGSLIFTHISYLDYERGLTEKTGQCQHRNHTHRMNHVSRFHKEY